MAKGKRRIDRSTAGDAAAASADSPFAGLAALRDQLPVGDAPGAEATPSKEKAADERSAGGEQSRDKASSLSAKAVVRRERSGRGGKTVTLVEQLGWPPAELAALAKKMKKALGCGARVEGDAVVLQGDLEERAAAWLEKQRLAKQVVLATAAR